MCSNRRTLHERGDQGGVDMVVKVKGVDRRDLERLVERTRDVYLYSREIRGNVTTNILIQEMD
ncbi:hypothetical protein E4U53_003710 [Claviceps sorghi]|nr:hypothetical protein E4U53_003710 [Claviceps sorghi]